MTEELLRFYKQTNDKEDIGWKTVRHYTTIGPNLQQLFEVLGSQGLRKRADIHQEEGGWSGDLYVVHRRLYLLQNEISRFFGDSGAGGPIVANVYDVTMNTTSGWTQYLSLIVKGPFENELAQKLTDLDFAPRYSYLAKNDQVPHTGDRENLWLEDFVEFPSVVSLVSRK